MYASTTLSSSTGTSASPLAGLSTAPWRAQSAAPAALLGSACRNDKRTILLIDDEERLLLGLATIMKRAGFEVVTASNGSHGLEMAKKCLPDVIVCDVMMPPPNGFEVRRLLSEDPATAAIPFLFLTARATLEDRVHGLASGADDYVTKPFERQELLARVEAILRRQELGRQRGRNETSVLVARLQDRLLGTMSSELRGPVSHLLMNLRGMLKERFGDDEERLREFVDSSIDNASRLQAMVDDLAVLGSFAREGHGALRFPIDVEAHLRAPIDQCVEHWRRWQMRDVDLTVTIDPDFALAANGDLFKRAVYHLVDNACKFSPEGGTVEVVARADGHGGGSLTVSDTGEGVVKVLREKVFDCYFQGELSELNRQGGLGIGLTIVRAVADHHGWTVAIVDSPQGCRVEMVFPPPTR